MTTRDAVLVALRDAGGATVSGETIARSIGVSRVAVGKHVAALRDAGYEIAAEPGAGYRLITAPDAPLPAEIAVLLGEATWMRLSGGGVTGSTNDDARKLARAGAPEGTVVLASQQLAGRGRLGREWMSPVGGAYFSAVLRPEISPAQLAPLSLVVGLGIARGLSAGLGVEVALKWPNDVLLGGGKLAGVLVETSAEIDRVDWVVVGIGLNVHRSAGVPRDIAACLDDAVPDIWVAAGVASALDGIARAYAQWQAEGFGAMRAEYERRSSLTGREVAVRDMNGTVRAAGTVAGVDDDGRLLVVGPEGTVPVVAGEVTLREPV